MKLLYSLPLETPGLGALFKNAIALLLFKNNCLSVCLFVFKIVVFFFVVPFFHCLNSRSSWRLFTVDDRAFLPVAMILRAAACL